MDKLTETLQNIAGKLPEFDSQAVLFALVAGWITGLLWYALASRIWSRPKDDRGGAGFYSPRSQILAGIAQVIITIMLAIAMQRLGETTTRGGIETAFMIWLGFVVTTMLVHHAHLGARFSLTVIDGIHWLLVFVVMGAIIGTLTNPNGNGRAHSTGSTPPAVSAQPTGQNPVTTIPVNPVTTVPANPVTTVPANGQ